MLAVVLDAPAGRPFSGPAGTLLRMVLDATEHASGFHRDVEVFYAVPEPTPGGKAPSIAAVRKARPELIRQLSESGASRVLTCGGAGVTSLSGAKRVMPVTKHRGRMQWLEVPVPGGLLQQIPWVPTISPGMVVKSPDLYRDFQADVWKVWTQREPGIEPDVDLRVVTSVEELAEEIKILDEASVVSVDVETTGFLPWADELLAIGLGAQYDADSYLAVVVPYELLEDPEVKDLVWDAVYRRGRRAVGHNLKFDLQFLMTWWGEREVPAEAMLGDTMLLAHLLDERPGGGGGGRPGTRARGLGLKDLSAVRYDAPDYAWDFDAFYATAWKSRDWNGLYRYLGLDVAYTVRLWHDLVAEAASESPRLMDAHDRVVMPASAVLAASELAGAPLDAGWLGDYRDWLTGRIERRMRALVESAPDLGAPEGFEPGSAEQVADLMYDVWRMTPDVRRRKGLAPGARDRSTAKDHVEAAISKYRSGPLARQAAWLRVLLGWRHDTKRRSTYTDSMSDRVDGAGRVHASFLLHGTSTGRLSSRDPNLQNVPGGSREDKGRWPVRRAFAPLAGSVWMEADYSNLELRVAAWLSDDEAFGQVFRDGKDIHLEVASTMFSKPPEDISKGERFLAKAVDFGILYGRTARALSRGVEMDYLERQLGGRRWSEQQAQAFSDKFLRGYPQLRDWIARTGAGAIRDHHVETPFGRRRRFPMIPRSKFDLWEIQRQAVNTPIQSAASDLCLQAMVRVARRLPDGARVLFPVHDSIDLEVREDLVDEVAALLREEMEIGLTTATGSEVPLEVSVEVGPSWADLAPAGP